MVLYQFVVKNNFWRLSLEIMGGSKFLIANISLVYRPSQDIRRNKNESPKLYLFKLPYLLSYIF